MRLWLRMRQAMAAMDVVMRSWGTALALSGPDLVVMMLLQERPRRCGADLATFAGRTRQNLQRTLDGLQGRGLVAPARHSAAGKVQAWELTENGLVVLKAIHARMGAWEQMLSAALELEAVTWDLERIVETIVHRPHGGNGWAPGLAEPRWDGAALEEVVRRESEALLAAGVPPELVAKRPKGARARKAGDAGARARTREAAAWQAVSENWDAMWR